MSDKLVTIYADPDQVDALGKQFLELLKDATYPTSLSVLVDVTAIISSGLCPNCRKRLIKQMSKRVLDDARDLAAMLAEQGKKPICH